MCIPQSNITFLPPTVTITQLFPTSWPAPVIKSINQNTHQRETILQSIIWSERVSAKAKPQGGKRIWKHKNTICNKYGGTVCFVLFCYQEEHIWSSLPQAFSSCRTWAWIRNNVVEIAWEKLQKKSLTSRLLEMGPARIWLSIPAILQQPVFGLGFLSIPWGNPLLGTCRIGSSSSRGMLTNLGFGFYSRER